MPPTDANADAEAEAGFKVGAVYPVAAAPPGTVAPVKVGDVTAAVACPRAALTVCWTPADASASEMGVPTGKLIAALHVWPADASDSAAAAAPEVETDGAKNMPLADIANVILWLYLGVYV